MLSLDKPQNVFAFLCMCMCVCVFIRLSLVLDSGRPSRSGHNIGRILIAQQRCAFTHNFTTVRTYTSMHATAIALLAYPQSSKFTLQPPFQRLDAIKHSHTKRQTETETVSQTSDTSSLEMISHARCNALPRNASCQDARSLPRCGASTLFEMSEMSPAAD